MVDEAPRRYGELTRGILGVLAAGAFVVTLAALPGLAFALQPFVRRRRYQPAAMRRSLYRLRAERLVRFRKRAREITVVMTDRGRQRLVQYRLAELTPRKPGRWDGQWRMIIFDIPEERRAARAALRARLRQLEFHQLQRSVFITPYPCREAVEFLNACYGVERYVHYLEVSSIDCNQALRQHFDL
ncbi:hypothetical protein HYW67_03560 [Candidatus Parcubacteria bacterium]|nr:hypothetical protein [Candidatus Parcubacteria bacterium]